MLQRYSHLLWRKCCSGSRGETIRLPYNPSSCLAEPGFHRLFGATECFFKHLVAALLFSVQRKASTIRVPSLVPRPEGWVEAAGAVLWIRASSCCTSCPCLLTGSHFLLWPANRKSLPALACKPEATSWPALSLNDIYHHRKSEKQ